MDCVKNLTSCSGCTRKHARCHWRDVSREELGSLDMGMDGSYDGELYYANGHEESEDDDSNPLEDLEALEEQEEGLRNARELSRMGWEEGIKSVVDKDQGPPPEHQPEAPTNGERENQENISPKAGSSHQKNEINMNNDSVALGAEQQALTASQSVARNTSPGAGQTSAPAPAHAPAPASEEHRPSLGGFRAVNEVGANSAVTGWRE